MRNVHYWRSVLASQCSCAWDLVWVDKVVSWLGWDVGINSSCIVGIKLTHLVHTSLKWSFTWRGHLVARLLERIIRVILLVLLYLMRNYDFVSAVVLLWNTSCMSLVCWVDILLNLVMDMIDVLNVLLMIKWAVKVYEALWNCLLRSWLLIMTTSTVGLTSFMIEVRHMAVFRLVWFFDRYFTWVVWSLRIIQNLVNSNSLLSLHFLGFFGLPVAR